MIKLPDGLPKPDWHDPLFGVALYRGDCLDVLPKLPKGCIDLVCTDPPYYEVLQHDWDQQWKTEADFFDFIKSLIMQFRDLIVFNGSLYMFTSGEMNARIECLTREYFNVLTNIAWSKGARSPVAGTGVDITALRKYWPSSERIIFAEQKTNDAYSLSCNQLKGRVYIKLQQYLRNEWLGSGKKIIDANHITGNQMANHYFSLSQWCLPTEENYKKLQEAVAPNYLRREYEDLRREYEDLRREYEDLRREYEDLRRPFYLTKHKQWGDVWAFKIDGVNSLHPCQKPIAMMEQIVNTSSRPNNVVLDAFMGSCATGVACVNLGRAFIGIEKEPKYFDIAVERISQAIIDAQNGELFATHEPGQMDLDIASE
jgi:site-specific DNA-methyltransferase (adenine-specific)